MIQISERYFIDSDKLNWILKEKRVSDPNHPLSKSDTPNIKYVDLGYFGKIEHLINFLLNKDLRDSESKSIQDLKEMLFQTESKVKSHVKELLKVEN